MPDLNDHVAVRVEGGFDAIDLCEEILQTAARDCRQALQDANIWATITITNDNVIETV